MRNGRKLTALALPIIIGAGLSLASTLTLAQPAQSKSKAVEFMKYFNPVPEKSYLNQSQDRVIKKKGFKTLDVPGAEPVENRELGYFILVPVDKLSDTASIEEALKRDDVNGISVMLPWRMLEPVEAETNFKPIDDLLALAKAHNKSLILRVSTCGMEIGTTNRSDCPDWVFKDPQVRSIIYTGTDGNEHQMPVFWDTNYLAKWSNLINELAENYDKNPALHSVGITGSGVLGSTNVLPDFVASVKETIGEIVDKKGKPAKTEGDEAATEATAKDGDKEVGDKEAKAESKDEDGKTGTVTEEPKETAENQESQDADKDKDKEKDQDKTASKDSADEKTSSSSKDNRKEISKVLEKRYGMNERRLVEHWKYVADIFPKAFETTRLNFNVCPPIPNRKGQDALDEISDYLVYRYGQRVYLTRQNVKDGKHGFDDYRVLLKFHPDTFIGYQLTPDFDAKEIAKLQKNAAEDGISFMELPVDLMNAEGEDVKTALKDIRQHMGYQLVSREVQLPKDLKVGQPLTASFTFLNLGAASAMKPSRQLDKDVASSYKVQLELRNESGKAVVRSLHTPEIPTNQWGAGKPISWQEELKMPPKLAPGKYDVYLSVVDSDTKRKLRFLNAPSGSEPKSGFDAQVGSIEIVQ